MTPTDYRQLKARALEQALVPQRKTPTQAVLAWRAHLLKLLALHLATPTHAELLQLQRASEAALRARKS